MIIDWLTAGAYVSRHINPLYIAVVVAIAVAILAYIFLKRDRPAINVFIYGFLVWLGIESFGLATGMRVYECSNPSMLLFFIAFFEDAAWCALAFIVARWLYRRWKRKHAPAPTPRCDIRSYTTSAKPHAYLSALRGKKVVTLPAKLEPYETRITTELHIDWNDKEK